MVATPLLSEASHAVAAVGRTGSLPRGRPSGAPALRFREPCRHHRLRPHGRDRWLALLDAGESAVPSDRPEPGTCAPRAEAAASRSSTATRPRRRPLEARGNPRARAALAAPVRPARDAADTLRLCRQSRSRNLPARAHALSGGDPGALAAWGRRGRGGGIRDARSRSPAARCGAWASPCRGSSPRRTSSGSTPRQLSPLPGSRRRAGAARRVAAGHSRRVRFGRTRLACGRQDALRVAASAGRRRDPCSPVVRGRPRQPSSPAGDFALAEADQVLLLANGGRGLTNDVSRSCARLSYQLSAISSEVSAHSSIPADS